MQQHECGGGRYFQWQGGLSYGMSDHAICLRELNAVHIGRLYVKPYHYRFETHAKGRWVGRTLLQVFQQEFPYQPQEYFVRGTTTIRATNR